MKGIKRSETLGDLKIKRSAKIEDLRVNLNNAKYLEVVSWYELNLGVPKYQDYKVDGYFKNNDIAVAAGKSRRFYGNKGDDSAIIEKVLVLTIDGKTGYIIKPEKIELINEEKRLKIIEKQKQN